MRILLTRHLDSSKTFFLNKHTHTEEEERGSFGYNQQEHSARWVVWIRTYHCIARRHFLHAQHHFLIKCGRPEDLRHQTSTARLLCCELSSTEQHLIGLPSGTESMRRGLQSVFKM